MFLFSWLSIVTWQRGVHILSQHIVTMLPVPGKLIVLFGSVWWFRPPEKATNKSIVNYYPQHHIVRHTMLLHLNLGISHNSPMQTMATTFPMSWLIYANLGYPAKRLHFRLVLPRHRGGNRSRRCKAVKMRPYLTARGAMEREYHHGASDSTSKSEINI